MASCIRALRVSNQLKDLLDHNFVSWGQLCKAVLGTGGPATPFRRRCTVRTLSDLIAPESPTSGCQLVSVSLRNNNSLDYVVVRFNGKKYVMRR